MERLTVFDGEFWVHKNFPPVEEDRVDEFIDCVKELAARLAAYEDTGLAPVEVQQMRWIPVEERLPNPKQNVLAYSPKSGIAEADYADGFWMQYRWSSVMDSVTHWMPLPQPPKEETYEK